MRRRPYAVVLFDEIEKAHREVLNVMLQLLDDGRLTDGKGRTVDFKNTVVIMTSNVGSHFIADAASATERERRSTRARGARCMDALRAHFRPEFLNRVDEIIVFHALSREQMRQIIDIQLRGLMKRLEDREDHVELTRRGEGLLIAEGYDPTYGARPLKRTIQRRVLDPLALRVLQGDSGKATPCAIDAAGGELRFDRGERGPRARLNRRTDQLHGRRDPNAPSPGHAAAPATASWARRAGLGDVVRPGVPAAPGPRPGLLLSCRSGDTLSYSDFRKAVRDGQVRDTVGDDRIRGALKNGRRQAARRSRTVRVEDPKLVEELEAHNVKYTGEVDQPLDRARSSAGSSRSSSWSRSGASSSGGWAAPKAA